MIYGELPNKPVVFAACDKEYFFEHAPSLIYSLNDIGKDIHIHICDPNPAVHRLETLLREDIDVDITYSYNDIGATPIDVRAYYSCLRFMVLPEILRTANKVLTERSFFFSNEISFSKVSNSYKILKITEYVSLQLFEEINPDTVFK